MAPAPANVAPPAWRAHLFALAPSEGYDPSALLTELGSESRPLFTIVDCETLVRESKDPDVVADLKACGGEVRGGMMAKCLVAKLAEDIYHDYGSRPLDMICVLKGAGRSVLGRSRESVLPLLSLRRGRDEAQPLPSMSLLSE